MGWELEWGGKLEFLKTLEEQGTKVDALRNRPRLKAWNLDYYNAFNVLSSSRPSGMGGVGPIPLSEILAYFSIFEIHDPDDRVTYITMMQSLDSVYLSHINKRTDKVDNAAPAIRKPQRRR